MIRVNIDRHWLFTEDAIPFKWWEKKKGTAVDLPHDYSIIQKRDPNSLSGASGGFFPGGVSGYEKNIFIPKEWAGKKVIVEFEGVYMNSTMHINNQLVARQPYGYTSFHCDLTPYLLYDCENWIRVTVNNGALPNSRWYSGSGIYRHVCLMVGDPVHITPWGIYATTPEVSSDASVVSVRTTVENSGLDATCVTVRSTLLTANGQVAAAAEGGLEIPSSSTSDTEQFLSVSPANLWSVDNPYLYTLKSEIIRDGNVIDMTETRVGIRSIQFDAQEGFQLNGISMKLKGGNVHHDCGLLGSAAYDRAEERKVELLKANGYNAVRCAHNPPSPAFLDACDRLGMLVIDEAFDCWRECKNPHDYSCFFEDWWERDMTAMVLRDRNHPSIIMWSTGNEIIERLGRSEGYSYARRLADYVRNLDKTRPITNAICGMKFNLMMSDLKVNLAAVPDDFDYWGELSYKYMEPLDIVGYNYQFRRYESDGKKYPGRIIYGAETHAKDAFDNWAAVERLHYVIGDFVWSGLDYLGEAGLGHVWYNGENSQLGNYPWHLANCGDIDICGFKRPQSYYRDCVWGISKSPYIAVYKPENYGKTPDVTNWSWPDVVSSWIWPGFENKPVVVDVYSSDSEIELFLNGRSLGRKPAGKANRYIAAFDTLYEPGELAAVGYNNGIESSRTILRTAGKPAAIRLTPDRSKLKAEFGDLSFITIEILDSEGNLVHNASNNVFFTVSGAGSLLAVGSSNPISEEMYVGNQRKVYEGRAVVVVRSSGETGNIILTAAAEGIPTSSATIHVG